MFRILDQDKAYELAIKEIKEEAETTGNRNATAKNVQNLMDSLGVPFEKAMELLKIFDETEKSAIQAILSSK